MAIYMNGKNVTERVMQRKRNTATKVEIAMTTTCTVVSALQQIREAIKASASAHVMNNLDASLMILEEHIEDANTLADLRAMPSVPVSTAVYDDGPFNGLNLEMVCDGFEVIRLR